MHNAAAHAYPVSAALPRALRLEASALTARLLAHPFMQRCADGSISMTQLRRFLVQQGKYSAHFTRYLCALISNLAEAEDVLRLASNLVEELGYGEHGGVPHSRLYSQMLRSFGLSLDDEPTGPETQSLIDTMSMLCRQTGGFAGLGALCLGAEAVVPAVYSRVIDGFTSQGVDPARLTFFSIHVACDDDHAQTMFEMVDRLCAESPANKNKVLNGAEIAVNARWRFFDALAGEQH